MNKNNLKKGYYAYGNKGACWTNSIHIAEDGESETMCGVPMLARNWSQIWDEDEVGCEKCLTKYKNKTK